MFLLLAAMHLLQLEPQIDFAGACTKAGSLPLVQQPETQAHKNTWNKIVLVKTKIRIKVAAQIKDDQLYK